MYIRSILKKSVILLFLLPIISIYADPSLTAFRGGGGFRGGGDFRDAGGFRGEGDFRGDYDRGNFDRGDYYNRGDWDNGSAVNGFEVGYDTGDINSDIDSDMYNYSDYDNPTYPYYYTAPYIGNPD